MASKTIRYRDPAGAVQKREGDPDDVEDILTDKENTILPPVEPNKVVGCGKNYRARYEEPGVSQPDRPRMFFKGGPNVVIGHGNTLQLLPGKENIQFSAELGVVIGEQCRSVRKEEVPSVIGGYTCVNDITNHDDHKQDDFALRSKSFDGAAPMGPVVASPDIVPENPRIRLWVNGSKQQDSTDDIMHYSVQEVVSDISQYMTLEADDVVVMGTPTGGDRLSNGDNVEITIEGIGTLTHTVTR